MTEETSIATSMWVQLRLKHPALGDRHRERFMRYEGDAQERLRGILYRDPSEARIVCECRGLLHAELSLAATQRARSLPQMLSLAGVMLDSSDCTRCLEKMAISLAQATGESPRALRDEAAALMRGLGSFHAQLEHAYSTLGDDEVRETSEPELIYGVSEAPE